ncbi:MAG: preprotein translocase subunit SecA [Candidatus Aceula meridiana]|nr:preprotein translocase subunit SecA [Candidatus Aceula meridiana]
MLDFLIGKTVIRRAQKFIDALEPKVNIHFPLDLPLPSVGMIKKMAAVASQINGLEEGIMKLSDQDLRAKTEIFKQRIKEALALSEKEVAQLEKTHREAIQHESREEALLQLEKARETLKKQTQSILDLILPEAFAVVREASRRTIGLRHFDVQLVGGMILHKGNIAEMATGEGKTLVATLPVYLNALIGKGVHVVTVNDYLANRDSAWMGPVYKFLGLTIGVIQHDNRPQERKGDYGCDITYGTNNEFGFDYLRDNMVNFKEEMVQRERFFAVIDEVDSILVDEARTPLIISGPAEESTDKYYTANQISNQMKGRRITENEEIDAKYKGEDLSEGFDYVADEKARSISLTDQGEEKAAKMFGVDNLHDIATAEYRHHVLQALKAKEFFKRDVDYVVRDGQVIIVDEFTGRMMPGRRWSDGLHQAAEAREGIKIERENQTLATVTFQNFFRMYDKLSGMTGTANTEATEFKQIYDVDCVVLPTNKVLQRRNYPDCIYKTEREKFNAVVDEIAELHSQGRPVLVGTISIERSEHLSQLLKVRGVEHQVLNAKYHDLEAHIVAQAGRYKAVTIATNMAGRGTDIVLGGNAEYLAKSLLAQKTQEKEQSSDEQTDQPELYEKFLQQFRAQTAEEHAKVIEAGGLHVLGTERHESRRIDNQLRGRSGRQGDPGSSRFYVSLQDDLMRLFGSDRIMSMMDSLGMEEGQVIENPIISRAIEIAQKRVETHNFEIRKHLLDYADVMNKQREVIYGLRQSVLNGENTKERIIEAIDLVVNTLVTQYLFTQTAEGETQWDIKGLVIFLKTNFGLNLNPEDESLKDLSQPEIEDLFFEKLKGLYEEKEKALSPEQMRELERIVLLQTIDSKWKDHLRTMDELRDGIGWRQYGQRDPVVEYRREGFEMFEMMYGSILQEAVGIVFRVEAVTDQDKRRSVFRSVPQQFVHNEFSSLGPEGKRPQSPRPGTAPELGRPSAPRPQQKTEKKVGRNDPCPCGSGKKYKKCCGR